MKKLFEAKPELLLSGLFPSVDSYGVPLWLDGQNVISRDNAIQPIFGHSSLFPKPDNLPITGLETLIRGGKRTVVFGNRINLYMWQQGDATATEVTRVSSDYTGTDNDRWSIQSYGEAVLATNGVDVVQYLGPVATKFVDLNTVASSNYPSGGRAKVIFQDGPFILLFNLDTGQSNVQWSDEDSIISWTPTAGNLAGDLSVRDLDSDIIAVQNLGTGMAIYGRDQLHAMVFQGAPLVYAQGHSLNGIGACGKHSVAQVGRLNYGMGPRGIFRTDGVEFVYLDEPAIHRYIYDDINADRYDQVVCWAAISEGQVYFCYPSKTAVLPDRCVSVNFKTGSWWKHGVKRTAAISSTVFVNPITATSGGDVMEQHIEGQTAAGEPTPIWLEEQWLVRMGYGEGGYDKGFYGGDQEVDNYSSGLDNPAGVATIVYVNAFGIRFNLSVALDTATCYLETKDLDLSLPDFRKALQGVLLAIANLDLATNLRFQVGYRNTLQEAIQYTLPLPVSASTPITRSKPPEARYYRIKIQDSGITTIWRLSQLEVHGTLAGKGPGM